MPLPPDMRTGAWAPPHLSSSSAADAASCVSLSGWRCAAPVSEASAARAPPPSPDRSACSLSSLSEELSELSEYMTSLSTKGLEGGMASAAARDPDPPPRPHREEARREEGTCTAEAAEVVVVPIRRPAQAAPAACAVLPTQTLQLPSTRLVTRGRGSGAPSSLASAPLGTPPSVALVQSAALGGATAAASPPSAAASFASFAARHELPFAPSAGASTASGAAPPPPPTVCSHRSATPPDTLRHVPSPYRAASVCSGVLRGGSEKSALKPGTLLPRSLLFGGEPAPAPHAPALLQREAGQRHLRTIASSRQVAYDAACRAYEQGDWGEARRLLRQCTSDGQALLHELQIG
eukprot:TRINITY_DN28114_c0_g1_i1.p1 TRINITY_DN28114_c0_g1~~TRINITY_DN28114_c0_g1_i1.p1  ORF type:complete len:360 (+),score=79.57 TRINITY_DN28114_c0_g1_i1:31-1080(+)